MTIGKDTHAISATLLHMPEQLQVTNCKKGCKDLMLFVECLTP